MSGSNGRQGSNHWTAKGSAYPSHEKDELDCACKGKERSQSARRYERAIEESINDYVKRISETINDIFAQNNFKIKGLLVGGPGPAKEGFIKGNTLNYQIKILGTYDTGYTD